MLTAQTQGRGPREHRRPLVRKPARAATSRTKHLILSAPQKPQSTHIHTGWLTKPELQVQSRAVNFTSCTDRLGDAANSYLGCCFSPEFLNGHKRPAAMSHGAITAYTTHTEEVRFTHQQHQHEHFRLSHPTPGAVPRGHDAVATSGYAGAIAFPRSVGHGAKLHGKCSLEACSAGRRCTCVLQPASYHSHVVWIAASVSAIVNTILFLISIKQPYCKTVNYTREQLVNWLVIERLLIRSFYI